MLSVIKHIWVKFMLWLDIVKVLLKHAKQIQKDLKAEKSSKDDTPFRITPDEYAIVITEQLLEAVPELVEIFQKRNKK